MTDRVSRVLFALTDLAITFLPVVMVFTLLAAFDKNHEPRPDISLLVATMFIDAAWRSRLWVTNRLTEKWSAILVGACGAIIAMVAAMLLMLVEMQVLQFQHNLGVRTFALWVSFYGYLVAIPYAIYVRYHVSCES